MRSLNDAEVDALECGSELDRVVAEAAFGLKVARSKSSSNLVAYYDGQYGGLPNYSTDLESALVALEEWNGGKEVKIEITITTKSGRKKKILANGCAFDLLTYYLPKSISAEIVKASMKQGAKVSLFSTEELPVMGP